jgi:SagB-type dehydrogenase family enzyme
MTEVLKLPNPVLTGSMSLEAALNARRTTRTFQDIPLEPRTLGQLLWAVQGINSPDGLRTAPSAGAMYPLETYVTTQEYTGHYDPHAHSIEILQRGDLRISIARAALDQDFIRQAPCSVLLSAVPGRTSARYGVKRSSRYIAFEVGHAAQNLLLQATALGLGSVPVGAFDDGQIAQLFGLPAEQEPLYIISIGLPASSTDAG